MAYRILCVGDEPQTAGAMKRLLESAGYEVRAEKSYARAVLVARAFQPHVVILDDMVPKLHGGDVAWQLASDPLLRGTRAILCSGGCEQEQSAQALPAVPICVVERPVERGNCWS